MKCVCNTNYVGAYVNQSISTKNKEGLERWLSG